MSYTDKFLHSAKLKLIIGGILMALAFLFLQGSASAAFPDYLIPNQYLPRADAFSQGNGVHLVTAECDQVNCNGNYRLDAPESTTRIYVSAQQFTLFFIDGGWCTGSGRPDRGAGRTIYRLYWLNPIRLNDPQRWTYPNTPFTGRGGPIENGVISSDNLGCGVTPVTLRAEPNTASQLTPFAGKYGIEIEARVQSGVGWNMYRLQVNPGRMSYYAGSTNKFGLKDRSPGLPGPSGNFRMGFAPSCNLDSPTTRAVRWFDADAGETNQGGQSPVQTEVIEYNQAGAVTEITPINITTGNNVGGSRNITIRPGHKYQWVWYGIHSANGIQFELPFDSYNTAINYSNSCPTNRSASCTITAVNPSSPDNNQNVTITVSVSNTGQTNWPAGYTLRQISPGGASRQIGALNNGQSRGGFNFTTGTSYADRTQRFTYRVFDSGGTGLEPNNPDAGHPCYVDINWRSPVQGPTVTASCSSVHLSNIASRATDPAGERLEEAYVRLRFTSGPQTFDFGTQDLGDADRTFWVPNILGPEGGSGEGEFDPFNWNYPQWSAGWPGTYPHGSYHIVLSVLDRGKGTFFNPYVWEDVAQVDLNDGHPCMNVLDDLPVTQPDLEPGESATLSYGLVVNNATSHTYPTNIYGVQIGSASPGIVGPAGQAYGQLNPGPNNFSVAQTYRIDYTGQLYATLILQGGDINGLMFWDGVWHNIPLPALSSEITPKTRPFLKVTRGDANIGGGFRIPPDDRCPGLGNKDFISPNPSDPESDVYVAGIRTFGKPSARQGASVDFGALALGLIDDGNEAGLDNDGPFGMYSRAINGSGYRALDFANDGNNLRNLANELGGLMGGAQPINSAHCITDYFHTTPKKDARLITYNPVAEIDVDDLNATDTDSNGIAGQFFYKPAPAQPFVTIHGGAIKKDDTITVYVQGDVYIDGNITYPSNWDIEPNENSVPYLAIIAEGDIHIAPSVSSIEGLYVAQPLRANDGTLSKGIFSTCSPSGTIAGAGDLAGVCRGASSFTLNGAVVAKRVVPVRSNGTLVTGGPAMDFFNFTPAIILGVPNFRTDSGVVVPNSLEALFSLPPVF